MAVARSSTTAARKPASKGPSAKEAAAIAASCTRFLAGDGPRNVTALLATIPPDTTMDYYGVGGAVTELENEVAAMLAKPAALFLPTGTMAQQATLRVHADRRHGSSIAFHPACHLDSHEESGYQRLHGLFGVPVGARREPLTVASLEEVHQPIAALVIELPQRNLGGTLPTWDELERQVAWARDRGAAVHLDGARLWEAAPYYATKKKTIADVAGLFDSVYVSFYKGLGGIAGCCVAGETDVVEELSVWRTRHGGRTFMMWPYAASALTVLRERPQLMAKYYQRARAIARSIRDIPGIEVMPDPVQSPLMHIRIAASKTEIRRRVLAIAKRDGVMTLPNLFSSDGPTLQRFEFQVGAATMTFSVNEITALFRRLASARTR